MKIAKVVENGILLRVKVIPRASRSEFAGEFDGRLKIRLNSPPVDGAANKELVKLVSKYLRIPKSSIQITSGSNTRKKTLLIEVSEDVAHVLDSISKTF